MELQQNDSHSIASSVPSLSENGISHMSPSDAHHTNLTSSTIGTSSSQQLSSTESTSEALPGNKPSDSTYSKASNSTSLETQALNTSSISSIVVVSSTSSTLFKSSMSFSSTATSLFGVSFPSSTLGTFEPSIVTATVTSIPSGFSAITLSGPSYTSNGWLTTTDASEHTTLLPFIINQGFRIAFWKLPQLPRVKFDFPGFPKFHLPCIKIFGIEIGHCESDPVTDGPADPSTSTSYLPASPLGPHVPPVTTSEPSLTNELARRARVSTDTSHSLAKRGGAVVLTAFGDPPCALTTPPTQPLTRPAYPYPYPDLLQDEQAGLMNPAYSVISRYDRATSINGLFTTTRLDANSFANAPHWDDYLRSREGNKNNDVSLDHAYETNWLIRFFDSLRGPTFSIKCQQMNRFFFTGDQGCWFNLIQQVFDALASTQNLQFIAMSAYLNTKGKAPFFDSFNQPFINDPTYDMYQNPQYYSWLGDPSSWSAKETYRDMFSYFQQVLYGVLIMQSDNMFSLIIQTNNRIYSAWLAVHAQIRANEWQLDGDTITYDAIFPPQIYPDGIASAYQEFMSTVIEPEINTPPTYLSLLWSTRIWPMLDDSRYLPDVMPQEGMQGPSYEDWLALYNEFVINNDHYLVPASNPESYTWEYSFQFEFTRPTKQDLVRLRKRQGSCSRSITDASSASGYQNATLTGSQTLAPLTSSVTTQPSASFTMTASITSSQSPLLNSSLGSLSPALFPPSQTSSLESFAGSFSTSSAVPSSSFTSANSPSSSSLPASEPLCQPFADPDHGVAAFCTCVDGSHCPLVSGTGDVCPYGPTPQPSTAASLSSAPLATTSQSLGGEDCIYSGCPAGYVCNDMGVCVLDGVADPGSSLTPPPISTGTSTASPYTTDPLPGIGDCMFGVCPASFAL
ncbi:MAG: hypothetical protein M1820_009438 [Bogoriella megaspora]|nr:MAG: hypothetical protein M1820_009438 [Bogoriella megaspora]